MVIVRVLERVVVWRRREGRRCRVVAGLWREGGGKSIESKMQVESTCTPIFLTYSIGLAATPVKRHGRSRAPSRRSTRFQLVMHAHMIAAPASSILFHVPDGVFGLLRRHGTIRSPTSHSTAGGSPPSTPAREGRCAWHCLLWTADSRPVATRVASGDAFMRKVSSLGPVQQTCRSP